MTDGADVRALHLAKDAALSRWLGTHVALDAARRRAALELDASLEAHAGHLGALQAWQRAESRYLAARLGFRAEPLPSRRRT